MNNAGISESTPFEKYTEELYDKDVILSTSFMVSVCGQPSGFTYPASKFAVNGLSISLSRELGPRGIRVNAVAPGIIETDMMKAVPREVIDPLITRVPLRRLGQPQDIAMPSCSWHPMRHPISMA